MSIFGKARTINMTSCINFCRIKCQNRTWHARAFLHTNRKHKFLFFLKKEEKWIWRVENLSGPKDMVGNCSLFVFNGDNNWKMNFFIILLFPFSLSFLLTKMPKLHFRVHEIVLPTHLILTLPTLSFFSHHILSFWPVLSKTIVLLYQKNIEFLFIIHRVFFFFDQDIEYFLYCNKWPG